MIRSVETHATTADLLTEVTDLREAVNAIINSTLVVDIHTHIFPPQFNRLCSSGIDDLLNYHYLIAEMFRSNRTSYANFWKMSKAQRADLVWTTLFVDNTPISEAARGIVSVLNAFGLDARAPNLKEARAFFRSQPLREHLDRVLDLARVSDVVMTNDPLHEAEAEFWKNNSGVDERFHASLRLDALVNNWQDTSRALASQGLPVSASLSGKTNTELRRFLDRWIERMNPSYIAVSLPPEFRFPDDDARDKLLREVVLPTASEHSLALALMVGVRRRVNPALRTAGDGVGRADVGAIERLCSENSEVRFLATFLARENQHELCVAARKFSNLMPFGCWWFLNTPSIVSEITRERLELLGPSFIPQHSDARVLEQLIYKWKHAREAIADALFESYERLLNSGRAVTRNEIERDVNRLFAGNFREWVGLKSSESRIEAVS